eukprot:448461-Rhodomonas_salina.1
MSGSLCPAPFPFPPPAPKLLLLFKVALAITPPALLLRPIGARTGRETMSGSLCASGLELARPAPAIEMARKVLPETLRWISPPSRKTCLFAEYRSMYRSCSGAFAHVRRLARGGAAGWRAEACCYRSHKSPRRTQS